MYNKSLNDGNAPITIRAADPADAAALSRLAQRDSSSIPDGELLIALVDGEVRVAISVPTGETIADPFHRTTELADIVTLRASQLRGEPRRRRGPMPALASRGASIVLELAGAARPVGVRRTAG